MKHRIALVALALLILSVAEASSSPQYNYAQAWNAWDNSARDIYLLGFTDGYFSSYIAAAKEWLVEDEVLKAPQTPRVKAAAERIFLAFPPEAIRDVVTSLYSDPANQFINFPAMIYIARDKLKGVNVESALQAARKESFEHHQILESLPPKRQ